MLLLITYLSCARHARPSESIDNIFLGRSLISFVRLPDWLVHRMLFNNAVSAGVGLVPIVGDIILASFKANSRNAALLEDFLRIRGEEFLKQEVERVQDPKVVRPGAGLQPGEAVPAEHGSTAVASTQALIATGDGAAKGTPKPPRRNSSGWRSMFGSRKGAPVTPPATAPAADSRFVEHVSNSNSKPAAK